jgi:hypothetical protein
MKKQSLAARNLRIRLLHASTLSLASMGALQFSPSSAGFGEQDQDIHGPRVCKWRRAIRQNRKDSFSLRSH